MRLLLDTHVLLWSLGDVGELAEEARLAIVEGANAVFVSAASTWEIGIKKGLGKLKAPADLEAQLRRKRFTPLDVTVSHGLAVEHLPRLHGDPFDRLLIVQARVEGLTLVTRDRTVLQYDVPTLRA